MLQIRFIPTQSQQVPPFPITVYPNTIIPQIKVAAIRKRTHSMMNIYPNRRVFHGALGFHTQLLTHWHGWESWRRSRPRVVPFHYLDMDLHASVTTRRDPQTTKVRWPVELGRPETWTRAEVGEVTSEAWPARNMDKSWSWRPSWRYGWMGMRLGENQWRWQKTEEFFIIIGLSYWNHYWKWDVFCLCYLGEVDLRGSCFRLNCPQRTILMAIIPWAYFKAFSENQSRGIDFFGPLVLKLSIINSNDHVSDGI